METDGSTFTFKFLSKFTIIKQQCYQHDAGGRAHKDDQK